MNLPKERTLRMRLLAIVLCLLAFSVYFTFAPTLTNANKPGGGTCDCGSCGTCTGHDECRCLLNGSECIRGEVVLNSCNCGGC